jgi:hypothetical protein
MLFIAPALGRSQKLNLIFFTRQLMTTQLTDIFIFHRNSVAAVASAYEYNRSRDNVRARRGCGVERRREKK